MEKGIVVCICEDIGRDTRERWVWHEEKANHMVSSLGRFLRD